jgi:hypothetical protein
LRHGLVMWYNIPMKHTITQEQIVAILQTVYQTNISASTFDSLKKLFADLPKVDEPKPEEPKKD